MKLQESGENYLEAILLLKQEKGAVRSIDIAQWMNFSKPSISRAMSLLREKMCIRDSSKDKHSHKTDGQNKDQFI